METITFTVKYAGTLPGTSRWVVEELKKRNAYLSVGESKNGKPGALLHWKETDKEGKESNHNRPLASFYAPFGYGSPKVCTFPFEEEMDMHEPVSLWGVALTTGGQAVFSTIIEKAAELLTEALEKDDIEVEPVEIAVN